MRANSVTMTALGWARMAFLLGMVPLLGGAFQGCAEAEPGVVDRDRDYYTAAEDCNDNDRYVNPGQIEDPSNGIDDDCDGQIDEFILASGFWVGSTMQEDGSTGFVIFEVAEAEPGYTETLESTKAVFMVEGGGSREVFITYGRDGLPVWGNKVQPLEVRPLDPGAGQPHHWAEIFDFEFIASDEAIGKVTGYDRPAGAAEATVYAGSFIARPDADPDKDGWPHPEDCDSYNGFVNPGALEILGNGLDDNCDGVAE